MVRGFKHTAVVHVSERDILKIFQNVKKTFDLSFENYRCGFYGRKSLFAFNNKKHYNVFVLHCNLNGITVYDHMD